MSEKTLSSNQWTPENLKKQAERTKSDASLINKGAEYVMDENSNELRLNVPDDFIEELNQTVNFIKNKYKDQPEVCKKIEGLIEQIKNRHHNQFEITSESGKVLNPNPGRNFEGINEDKITIRLLGSMAGFDQEISLTDIIKIESGVRQGDEHYSLVLNDELFAQISKEKDAYYNSSKYPKNSMG
jgi:hypothetical protein